MNKGQAGFIATMVVLTWLALFLAVGAAHHREGMAAFTMLVIAAIFWSRVQKHH